VQAVRTVVVALAQVAGQRVYLEFFGGQTHDRDKEVRTSSGRSPHR
jgi:hypothetical protein